MSNKMSISWGILIPSILENKNHIWLPLTKLPVANKTTALYAPFWEHRLFRGDYRALGVSRGNKIDNEQKKQQRNTWVQVLDCLAVSLKCWVFCGAVQTRVLMTKTVTGRLFVGSNEWFEKIQGVRIEVWCRVCGAVWRSVFSPDFCSLFSGILICFASDSAVLKSALCESLDRISISVYLWNSSADRVVDGCCWMPLWKTPQPQLQLPDN